MQFSTCRSCRDCELGSGRIRSVGIPTRPWDGHHHSQLQTALLLVGAFPAYDEDQAGKFYVGPTGQHMNGTYIKGAHLNQLADCYLTNAVRCFPRGYHGEVPDACIKACRGHLDDDIIDLAQHYKQVVVVACGGEAIKSVLGKTCGIGDFPQGTVHDFSGVPCTCFATYLPAILLRNRDPAKLPAIKDHLLLIRRFLRLGYLHPRVTAQSKIIGPSVREPPSTVNLLSLDIETYGAVSGLPKQTVFSPEHAVKVDGCPTLQLVQTVALAWEDHDGIRTKCYRVTRLDDRRALHRTLTRLVQANLARGEKLHLLSNNVQFDLRFLRYWRKEFRDLLGPDTIGLVDLSVTNFLSNDVRPERSLKRLCVLLGIDDYYDEPVDLRKGERYESADDPRLLAYNCKDAVTTLRCELMLQDMIRDSYGTDSPKRKSRWWFSDMLWLALRMSENGVCYSVAGLHERATRLEHTLDKLRAWGLEHDLQMDGEGVKLSQQAQIDRLVERWRPPTPMRQKQFDRRLLQTARTRVISTKDENLSLIRNYISIDQPDGPPDFQLVVRWQRFRRLNKLLTSYVQPLLGAESSPAARHIKGVVHPRWNVVPSRYADQAKKGKEGGTRQARFSAQEPPDQTNPEFIQKLRRCRFRDGAWLSGDESQIELRVPVIYSGDPIMLDLFQRGVSLHAKTATELFKQEIEKKRDPVLYDAGKHANFLRVYGGEADKLQQTILLLTHRLIPTDELQAWIAADRQRYPVFYAWQESLYATAERLHRLELPVSGLSRTFLGPVRHTYHSEVLNFPTQGLAAMLLQSAQVQIERELRQGRARTLSVSNVHDDARYEAPADEVPQITALMKKWLERPPLYDRLMELGYHPCPLVAEIKVTWNDGRVSYA